MGEETIPSFRRHVELSTLNNAVNFASDHPDETIDFLLSRALDAMIQLKEVNK